MPKLEQPADLALGIVETSATVVDKEPVHTCSQLKSRWTAASDYDARLHTLVRWRAALFHNLDGSEVGQMLRDSDPCLHIDMLNEVFEGKSTNALAKRVNSLLHYLQYWRLDETTADFLPFNSTLVYGYLKHLKSDNRLSAAQDFLQCARFCEYVIGLKSTDSLSRPWFSGIAKAACSHDRPKKESRPLTVKKIIRWKHC